MRTRSSVAVSAVVLLVLVAGCLGGGGGNGDGTPTDAPGDGLDVGGDGDTPPADTPAPDGTRAPGGDSAACGEGSMSSYRDPQSGQQVTMELEGMVTHEGRQVCKAVWEASGDAAQAYSEIVMFYAPDGSYQKYVYYDGQGNVLYEFRSDGQGAGTPAGTPGSTPTDGMGATPADTWCVEGQTTTMSNPQTGERTSMAIRGVVTHEGREACKAVWEQSGGQGEIQRMVWYYTQESEYVHILYYDGEGNLINEIEYGGGTSTAP